MPATTPQPLGNLVPGDRIYVKVLVDINDLADKNSKSTTAKK